MKIVIVQGAFLPVPPLMGGAVEKIWYRMGHEFAALGHEVVHLSRAHSDLPGEETQGGVKYRRSGGHDAPASMLKLKHLDWKYSQGIKKLIPADADIIVSNTFWLPIIASAKMKRKIYVDMQRMPKGQTKFYSKVGRIRANSSAVSQAVEAEAPQLMPLVRMIPNPLTFSLDTQTAPQRKNGLLYTGRVHPEKGLPILLEAFSALNEFAGDWELDIVGPWQEKFGGGGTAYWDDLRQTWPHPRVHWHGAIFDEAKLHDFYRRAKIFVYPSVAEKGETFGLAPLEAMASGCVPVVSDLSCFRDFIAPGRNGQIFDHRQEHPAAALAQILASLMADDDALKRLSAHAEEVNQTHSPRAIATQFLSDFEEVAGNHGRR